MLFAHTHTEPHSSATNLLESDPFVPAGGQEFLHGHQQALRPQTSGEKKADEEQKNRGGNYIENLFSSYRCTSPMGTPTGSASLSVMASGDTVEPEEAESLIEMIKKVSFSAAAPQRPAGATTNRV